MTVHLLITSTSLSCQSLISMLLTMPDCPAIRLIIQSEEDISPATLHLLIPNLQSDLHEIITIDRYEGPVFEDIFKDIDVVFHDGPILHPEDEMVSIAVINAAEAAGVSHFIFYSVFQSFRTRLPMHAIKLNLEEHLLKSHLNCTILQPARAMQEIPLKTTITSKKLVVPFSTSLQHGFVDVRDVALIARKIIFHPNRYNRARYELVGQNASYEEIANFISHATATNIKCETVTPAGFVAQSKVSGNVKTELEADFLMRTLLYHNSHPSTGNLNVLHWLLGQAPKTWEEFLQDELRDEGL